MLTCWILINCKWFLLAKWITSKIRVLLSYETLASFTFNFIILFHLPFIHYFYQFFRSLNQFYHPVGSLINELNKYLTPKCLWGTHFNFFRSYFNNMCFFKISAHLFMLYLHTLTPIPVQIWLILQDSLPCPFLVEACLNLPGRNCFSLPHCFSQCFPEKQTMGEIDKW